MILFISFSREITVHFSIFLFAPAAAHYQQIWSIRESESLAEFFQDKGTWHDITSIWHIRKPKQRKKSLQPQISQIYPVPESKSMLKCVLVYGAAFSQGAFIVRFSDYFWFLSLFHLCFFFVFLSDRVTL